MQACGSKCGVQSRASADAAALDLDVLGQNCPVAALEVAGDSLALGLDAEAGSALTF